MNEVFKKMNSERIELTDNFFLLPDGFNGIVLQRETEKIRRKRRQNIKTKIVTNNNGYKKLVY